MKSVCKRIKMQIALSASSVTIQGCEMSLQDLFINPVSISHKKMVCKRRRRRRRAKVNKEGCVTFET